MEFVILPSLKETCKSPHTGPNVIVTELAANTVHIEQRSFLCQFVLLSLSSVVSASTLVFVQSKNHLTTVNQWGFGGEASAESAVGLRPVHDWIQL